MAGEGGIEVISNAGLIEVQRWWETDTGFQSTLTDTNKKLFQADSANRTIFATAQLQALAQQKRQREIRELSQLLAVIAYAQPDSDAIRKTLEYIVQAPIAQNTDEGLWNFLRALFIWQADKELEERQDKHEHEKKEAIQRKLKTICEALFPSGTYPLQQRIAISVVATLAIEKLSQKLFASNRIF